MRRILISVAFAALNTLSFSQTITGRVIDQNSSLPLENATVKTSDNQEVKTNTNGIYTLKCAEDITVSVYVIGYSVQRQIIEKCNESLDFSMVEQFQELQTIDVLATSIQKNQLLDQPASVVRISEGEITRGTGLFLMDAVNTNTPGVNMQSRTTTGGQQFNIRGYGNGIRGTKGVSSNFDGQGTKVYLNGIPITDAEGINVMDDIDFGSISNVEILKGPSGTVYGSAIAGVVNLQSRKAQVGETSISQNLLFGSYGLLRSTTTFAVGTKNASYLVNYGHTGFDGFMPHTATNKNFVNMTGDFSLSDKQGITSYIGYSSGYDERNGELTIDQYDSLDYSGNEEYIKNDAHSAAQTFRAGIGHNYKIAPWVSNTTSLFGSNQYLDNCSAGGWTDRSSISFGLRSTFDMNFKLGDKIQLSGITGVEWQKTSTLANTYKMGVDSTDVEGYNTILSLKSIADLDNVSMNVFSQWTLTLPMEFAFTAGIGYNQLDMVYEDRLWGSANNTSGNITPKSYSASYNQMLSPTIGLTKQFHKNVSVYASYSSAYKAPVSSYFYIPQTGEVNTGLKPEKGTQMEIGTKGSILKNKLFYTLAVYNVKFTDKMTAITVQNPQNTATLYSYIVNGGTVNNTGVEAVIKYEAITSRDKFVTSLRPFANATYSAARYENYRFEKVGQGIAGQDSTVVVDYSGQTLAGIPPLAINAGIDVETKIGLYGNVLFNYRDAMYFTSDGDHIANSYSILNAKIGFRREIKDFTLDFYAGATNITSEQYYNMVFVNQLPDAYIPAIASTNFFGGVQLKYSF
jgi:iron complex outermembrane receptor protein